MRGQKRNKQLFHYALYLEKRAIEDNGIKTGEFEIIYSNPFIAMGNISAARGASEKEAFGINVEYDRVISLKSADMDEASILWIDVEPKIEPDGSTKTPHNYIVKRVARSLNSFLIAIQKVSVS